MKTKKRTVYKKTCPHCTKPFNTHHNDAKYCSLKCYGDTRKNRVNTQCIQCKKSIELIPSLIKEVNFCSQECTNQHKINSNKHVIKTIICETCKKEFTPKYRIKNQKYCSQRCVPHIQPKGNSSFGSPIYFHNVTDTSWISYNICDL